MIMTDVPSTKRKLAFFSENFAKFCQIVTSTSFTTEGNRAKEISVTILRYSKYRFIVLVKTAKQSKHDINVALMSYSRHWSDQLKSCSKLLS